MRTIFLNRYFHPDHSATSQMLSDLAFFLADSGATISVITSRQRYDDADADLPPRERINGVEVFRVRTSRYGRDRLLGRASDYATFYIAAGWQLWRLARAGDIVVAKTDPPLICVVAALVARMRGAKLVNWVQDLFPEVAQALHMRALAGPQAGLLRALRNWTFRSAAANVVLSARMAAKVERAHAGADSERRAEDSGGVQTRTHTNCTHVIPNWADKDAIRPIAAVDNPLRAEWGLRDYFVVCYSGNMGRAHEFDTILDAAERLAASTDKVRFLFIGNGARRVGVESAVRRRGLANVLFQPYQARGQLSLSLSVGDAHLVSLRPGFEGLIYPSKLYGIYAAGRPAIFVGDAHGEIAQLLESESAGIAVPQGEPAQLVDAILRLAKDAQLCASMGANARRLLCERYDKEIALAAWRKLLSSL